jgi:tight adherence protein B
LAVAASWSVLLLLGTQSWTLDAYNSAGGTLLLVIGAAVCVVGYRLQSSLPVDRAVPVPCARGQ